MPKNSSRWNRARSWGIPLVALAAGAGLGAGAMVLWGTDSEPTQAAFGAAEDSSQQTLTVELQTLEESVSATGTVAAVTSGSLAFEASGKVIAVNFEAGDVVEAGDVIAQIDTLQLTASLRAAESDLAQGEASVADLEDADDGSDASTAKIASAEARVAVLQQSVDDATDAMSDAQLVADISGLVTTQSYALGDVVSTGAGSAAQASTGTTSTGVSIVGQDAWTVSVSLSEDEVALIAEGDQVTFTADDVDDFYGIVTDISNLPSTTSGSATYAVDLDVTGTVAGLFDGTSVTADIAYLRQVDVLAIPTNAITTVDDVSTVTVVDDEGTETERTVTLGDSVGSYTPILDGLTEGEQLLVTVTISAGSSGTDDTQFPGDFPAGGFGDGEVPAGGMGGPPGN